MKLTWFDVLLAVVGSVVLRTVIYDNYRYLMACCFYGFCIGIGRVVFSVLDEE